MRDGERWRWRKCEREESDGGVGADCRATFIFFSFFLFLDGSFAESAPSQQWGGGGAVMPVPLCAYPGS